MVRDLPAAGCATMDDGQRRRHVGQGGTLAISVQDAQDHDTRVRMYTYGDEYVRDEHQR
jgi:hypothetical protein